MDQPARKSSLWERASAAIARVGLRSGGQDENEAGPDYATVQSDAVAQRKWFQPAAVLLLDGLRYEGLVALDPAPITTGSYIAAGE